MISAWGDAVYSLAQMNQATLHRPRTAYEVFELDETAPDEVVKFIVKPAVFFVPERPNRRRSDLYVVVKGWLTFAGPDFTSIPLKTKDFGTEVAYFRSKDGALQHVYGAHYDMDEGRAGHPVFHAQFGSQFASSGAIREQFQVEGEFNNLIGTTLGTVRTPSAQMDVFSVLTQIGADHLMGEASAAEVHRAFEQLKTACDFLIGAAHRMAFLNTERARSCYRSTHWYDAPAPNG